MANEVIAGVLMTCKGSFGKETKIWYNALVNLPIVAVKDAGHSLLI